MMVEGKGNFRHCCISSRYHLSNGNGEKVTTSNSSLIDAFNCKELCDIREQMVRGDAIRGCEHCYQQEKMGNKSYRQHNNDEWKSKLGNSYNQIVAQSIGNNYRVKYFPYYLDLRISNNCNLSCRTCHPCNSSSVMRNWRLANLNSKGRFAEIMGENIDGMIEVDNNSDQLIEEVVKNLPSVKKLYLTGGEPLLIKENYTLLDACVQQRVAKNIILFLNINMTVLPDYFLNVLSHFKGVYINMSLDGINHVAEYIRYGVRWQIVKKNIEKILSYRASKIHLGVTPVVQVYNLYHLPKMVLSVTWLALKYRRVLFFDFLYCQSPPFLDVGILPKRVKEQAVKKLKLLRIKLAFLCFVGLSDHRTLQSISGVIRYLKNKENSDENKIALFLEYTAIIDRANKVDITKIGSEMNLLLREINDGKT